tara:strand:+ start:7268 stop:7915 length:648 start_codon:yes stop_codon:yes gene_type:complete
MTKTEQTHLTDNKGRLVPINLVSDHKKLEDDTVRKIMGYAEELSAQIARFKGHTHDDLATLMDLISEKYGVKKGGKKGNTTFTTFDGCLKVQIAIHDFIEFGPELQIAKQLIDECIADWSAGTGDEIKALVNHAFEVDKPGQVNREALSSLRRLEIDDDRWRAAVEAINDSMRVVGSKSYIRFHRRATPDGAWEAVTIDISKAKMGASHEQAQSD